MNKSFDEVKDYLEDLHDEDLVQLWNAYCDEDNYADDHIYNMDEFDEIMGSEEPSRIAQRIYYGEFCPNDSWFIFDGCGNLKSGYADELADIDTLAHFIVDNENYLDDDDLEEFCEEDEE